MSSYVNFYIRVNKSFIPIGSYSRSNPIYRAINQMLPYEKITALTSEKIGKVIDEIKEEIEELEKLKEKDKQTCDKILSMVGNSVEEKMASIYSIEAEDENIDYELEELKYSKNILQVYLDMIDEIHYSEGYVMDNDYNHYIYAGVEAYGSMEDIFEDEN